MRIAAYNTEWFSELFDKNDQLLLDDAPSGRFATTRRDQADALGMVFHALDADAVMVVEAPNTGKTQNTVRALERFAAHYELRQSSALTGFTNDTQQEIALLYDPHRVTPVHRPESISNAPRFDGPFHIDLDVDARADDIRFSKPPLELELGTPRGATIRVIGIHLKSKAPHGAKRRDEIMRRSIANRRKQLAQAIWLRRRIDGLIADGHGVIVLGDLNDGPGLDEYEHLFGRSSVEIVMGEDLYDPHAKDAFSLPVGSAPSTSRFLVPGKDRFLQALLDYIFVSLDLMSHRPAWRIWHPFDDVKIWQNADLREALVTASDHFPVTLDIDI